jgi:hypothetical protein
MRPDADLIGQRLPRSEQFLCPFNNVRQQHRPRHRPDSTRHRRNEACDLVHLRCDIANQTRLRPSDSHIKYCGAWLHHLRGDQPGDSRSRNDHIGGSSVGAEVSGAGVAKGDGRVLTAPRQQQSERAPHSHASANNTDFGAVEFHAVAPEQLHDSPRGTGQGTWRSEHKASEVDGVQPIGILTGVHPFQHNLLIDPLWKRQLHDVARAGIVSIEALDRIEYLGLRGIGREVDPDRLNSHLFAVSMFASDIGVASRVVADQNSAQAGNNTSGT